MGSSLFRNHPFLLLTKSTTKGLDQFSSHILTGFSSILYDIGLILMGLAGANKGPPRVDIFPHLVPQIPFLLVVCTHYLSHCSLTKQPGDPMPHALGWEEEPHILPVPLPTTGTISLLNVASPTTFFIIKDLCRHNDLGRYNHHHQPWPPPSQANFISSM